MMITIIMMTTMMITVMRIMGHDNCNKIRDDIDDDGGGDDDDDDDDYHAVSCFSFFSLDVLSPVCFVFSIFVS